MAIRSPFRSALLFLSLARLIRDLGRLSEVLALNEQMVALRTADEERSVIDDFASSASGAEALTRRTRLGRLDLAAMRALSPETLGNACVRFLDAHGISPDGLPDRPVATDLDSVLAHFYETHDLWHVATGLGADVAGELGVQAFVRAQSRSYLPLFIMAAALLNTALYASEERRARVDALTRGWEMGRRARSFVGIDWKPLLGRPLVAVRAELGVAA